MELANANSIRREEALMAKLVIDLEGMVCGM